MTRILDARYLSTGGYPSRRKVLRIAAISVAAAIVVLGALVYLDYRNFDRTSGGYAPPYADWTGTPIDWAATERTDDGFRQRGRVVHSRLDCSTGMLSFEVLGVRVDFREVSPRALAVHRPREACAAAGFTPRF